MAGVNGKHIKMLIKLNRRLNKRLTLTYPDFEKAKKELRDILISAARGHADYEQWVFNELLQVSRNERKELEKNGKRALVALDQTLQKD
tara:strand:- start:124 stop:390 length:267 start_codon:yes stop_codon:yes gene_type:complete